MTRRIVVIGAGIAGVTTAACVSEVDGVDVVVLDRGPRGSLLGSTGLAPGLVGLFNEAPVLTKLAQASVHCYTDLSDRGLNGFDRVGGLEIATTPEGQREVERRSELANAQGLATQVLNARQAAAAAPALVDEPRCVGAVHYPDDGVAHAGVIVAALADRAAAAGARFRYNGAVSAIDVQGGRVRAVRVGTDVYRTDDVIIACGIWGPAVAALAGQRLALTPVAHPYVYSEPHAPAGPSPFVRWPEHHAYAREHGDRLGLGTYAHTPVRVSPDDLGTEAEQPWPAEVFDPAIAESSKLLPAATRFTPQERLNGVFAMTPDNLPLVGAVGDVDGLWAAQALWVTHAGGAARALAQLITRGDTDLSEIDQLDPCRFADHLPDELTRRALRLYRDIYAAVD